jgi:hypothetical protein
MAEIIELRHAESASNEQLFSAIFEMKVDLRAIDEFADALALISETMDESPRANAINRLVWEIKLRAQRLETRRGDLLGLAHPTWAEPT